MDAGVQEGGPRIGRGKNEARKKCRGVQGQPAGEVGGWSDIPGRETEERLPLGAASRLGLGGLWTGCPWGVDRSVGYPQVLSLAPGDLMVSCRFHIT